MMQGRVHFKINSSRRSHCGALKSTLKNAVVGVVSALTLALPSVVKAGNAGGCADALEEAVLHGADANAGNALSEGLAQVLSEARTKLQASPRSSVLQENLAEAIQSALESRGFAVSAPELLVHSNGETHWRVEIKGLATGAFSKPSPLHRFVGSMLRRGTRLFFDTLNVSNPSAHGGAWFDGVINGISLPLIELFSRGPLSLLTRHEIVHWAFHQSLLQDLADTENGRIGIRTPRRRPYQLNFVPGPLLNFEKRFQRDLYGSSFWLEEIDAYTLEIATSLQSARRLAAMGKAQDQRGIRRSISYLLYRMENIMGFFYLSHELLNDGVASLQVSPAMLVMDRRQPSLSTVNIGTARGSSISLYASQVNYTHGDQASWGSADPKPVLQGFLTDIFGDQRGSNLSVALEALESAMRWPSGHLPAEAAKSARRLYLQGWLLRQGRQDSWALLSDPELLAMAVIDGEQTPEAPSADLKRLDETLAMMANSPFAGHLMVAWFDTLERVAHEIPEGPLLLRLLLDRPEVRAAVLKGRGLRADAATPLWEQRRLLRRHPFLGHGPGASR